MAASPVAVSTVRSALGTVEIGFIAARTRSTSPVVIPPSVPPERCEARAMPPAPAKGDPVPHLAALDRLDAHQRAGELGVQPTVPVHVRAEAWGQPPDHH